MTLSVPKKGQAQPEKQPEQAQAQVTDLGAIGMNVAGWMEGTKLHIVIDTSKRLGDSASGKSVTVATTAGNKEIPGTGGVRVGINAYVKK